MPDQTGITPGITSRWQKLKAAYESREERSLPPQLKDFRTLVIDTIEELSIRMGKFDLDCDLDEMSRTTPSIDCLLGMLLSAWYEPTRSNLGDLSVLADMFCKRERAVIDRLNERSDSE